MRGLNQPRLFVISSIITREAVFQIDFIAIKDLSKDSMNDSVNGKVIFAGRSWHQLCVILHEPEILDCWASSELFSFSKQIHFLTCFLIYKNKLFLKSKDQRASKQQKQDYFWLGCFRTVGTTQSCLASFWLNANGWLMILFRTCRNCNWWLISD